MLIARFTEIAPSLNGRLEGPWDSAERSNHFVDMATGNPAILSTQAALLWDHEALYAGFWVEEPYPTARLTERDSLIFRENDVELFIDGGDCYYELEINALGTVYEMFFIWRDAYHRFDQQVFDVHRRMAYTFAGDFDRMPDHFWDGNHPRGARWAFRDFDMPGLRTAVNVDGNLNDGAMRSKGWTAEIGIPWSSLALLANGRSIPPKNGDVWNLFLGRFQQILIADRTVQAAWCVTPHGRYDTHMPEAYTPVVFSSAVTA
ncbi:MAG: carbohydrate-binding family 9-like protein [Fimbriimonadaceae bacterium]|nr:carbohydrate-binding family 9-like protein [Fimbriimonadaceae bacterium]